MIAALVWPLLGLVTGAMFAAANLVLRREDVRL